MSELLTLISGKVGKALDNAVFPSVDEMNYWEARKNRIFYIDGEIGYMDDGDVESKVCGIMNISKVILNMNIEEMNIPEKDLKPIIIMINSYGGDLDLSNNFCDIIKASRIPIITVALGYAMSAAFLIFISGHKRFVFRHSSLLVHQGSGIIGGSASEIEEAQKHYQKQLDGMKRYILDNTNIEEKVFNKNKKKDWYITADEALSMGVCDAIIEKLEDIKI